MFSTITTKFPGRCKRCGDAIPVGTRVRFGGVGRLYHFKADCPAQPVDSGATAIVVKAIRARNFEGRRAPSVPMFDAVDPVTEYANDMAAAAIDVEKNDGETFDVPVPGGLMAMAAMLDGGRS